MTGPTPRSLASGFRLPGGRLSVLNFMAMPMLVVAGTLLALRLQPQR
jgi:hypothetical protein